MFCSILKVPNLFCFEILLQLCFVNAILSKLLCRLQRVQRGDAQLSKALKSPFSQAREEALEAAAATMREATEAETKATR